MNWLKLRADGIDRIFFSAVFALITILGKMDEQAQGLEYANSYEAAGGNVVSILWWVFIAWLFISGIRKYRAS